MHDRNHDGSMAEIRDERDQRARVRPSQRTDAGEPVVALGALHGAGLAHPVEPDDRTEASAPATPSDMGSVCASGRRLGGDDRGTLVDNGVAPLGRIAGDTDAALCPEGTAGPVGTPISVGGVLRMLERQRFRCALSGHEDRTPPAKSADIRPYDEDRTPASTTTPSTRWPRRSASSDSASRSSSTATGVIVCGHTRWKAAQKLALEKVPVHVAKDLTPEQIRAYRIADNKTAELAEWDMDLLAVELGALRNSTSTWPRSASTRTNSRSSSPAV
jgi:hypothetical protein